MPEGCNCHTYMVRPRWRGTTWFDFYCLVRNRWRTLTLVKKIYCVGGLFQKGWYKFEKNIFSFRGTGFLFHQHVHSLTNKSSIKSQKVLSTVRIVQKNFQIIPTWSEPAGAILKFFRAKKFHFIIFALKQWKNKTRKFYFPPTQNKKGIYVSSFGVFFRSDKT